MEDERSALFLIDSDQSKPSPAEHVSQYRLCASVVNGCKESYS